MARKAKGRRRLRNLIRKQRVMIRRRKYHPEDNNEKRVSETSTTVDQ